MKHIRIISPSGSIVPGYVTQAKELLELAGYRVTIGTHAMNQYGRFAGSAEQRLIDINEALADANVDIILCSRGGYGLQQIIDSIQLPCRPKEQWPLVVGYSDITEIHSLFALYGVPTMHAPMCKEIVGGAILQFGNGVRLSSDKALRREGEAVGTVIGGNLSVLYGLQGTKWDLNHIIDTLDSAPILFIEDIAENHYHIDRMMNNLRLSGVLGRISGLVVGHLTDCSVDYRMMCSLEETIFSAVRDYDYPVMFGAPVGHEAPNLPLMLGAEYKLCVNATSASLTPLNS